MVLNSAQPVGSDEDTSLMPPWRKRKLLQQSSHVASEAGSVMNDDIADSSWGPTQSFQSPTPKFGGRVDHMFHLPRGRARERDLPVFKQAQHAGLPPPALRPKGKLCITVCRPLPPPTDLPRHNKTVAAQQAPHGPEAIWQPTQPPSVAPSLRFLTNGHFATAINRKTLEHRLHDTQIARWLQLLTSCGSHSTLFCVTENSEFCDKHRSTAIRKFAGSTLQRYLDCWDVWSKFAHAHHSHPCAPDQWLVWTSCGCIALSMAQLGGSKHLVGYLPTLVLHR